MWLLGAGKKLSGCVSLLHVLYYSFSVGVKVYGTDLVNVLYYSFSVGVKVYGTDLLIGGLTSLHCGAGCSGRVCLAILPKTFPHYVARIVD